MQVLSWIDICAGLSAKTLARGPCVTVSVDAVYFLRCASRVKCVVPSGSVTHSLLHYTAGVSSYCIIIHVC